MVSPGQGFPTNIFGFHIDFNRDKQVEGERGTKEEKLSEQKRMVVGPQEEGLCGWDEVPLGFLGT